MSSPPKRSSQTRGSNNPTRNTLHPPRGARSAVACRALSGAPTRPPVGPACRGAAERVRFPGGSGRAAGRARCPHSRVAVPLPTTAAGVVAPRRSPRPPAPSAHPRWSPSTRGPVVLHGWMRWFTWMAVLGPLEPPDIPQATPLPVPGKTSSQCSPRNFHSPRVQGLRRTSQSGACASPVLSRPPPHNPVTTPRTISPSSPQEGGSSPRDTQIKYKPVQVKQNGMPTSTRA